MKTDNSFSVKIAKKIEEFPQSDWDKVFPETLEGYMFFKTLEESRFPGVELFYIMVYDGDTPVAATTCFTMRFPFDVLVKGPLKFLTGVFKLINSNIFSPKVLMCGLLMDQGRIGISPSVEAGKVVQCINNCLERIARQEKASMIVYKDFSLKYENIFKPFLNQGFAKIQTLPSTDMDINFGSFDEFLQTLSPVSRSGIKRKFKKIDGKVKIALEVSSSLEEPDLSQSYELYLQTCKLHNDGTEIAPKDFFVNIAKNMPDESKFFLWRIGGKIVAFAFCLASEEHFIDFYLGLDYKIAYQYHLYFVRFRDLINWCIDHGIKKYEMGFTGYEAKKRLNFDFTRFYYYMKFRNRFLNIFLKFISNFLKPENFDPIFKKLEDVP